MCVSVKVFKHKENEMPSWLYFILTPFMVRFVVSKPVKGIDKQQLLHKIDALRYCSSGEKRALIRILKSEGNEVTVEESINFSSQVMKILERGKLQKMLTFWWGDKIKKNREYTDFLRELTELNSLLDSKFEIKLSQE